MIWISVHLSENRDAVGVEQSLYWKNEKQKSCQLRILYPVKLSFMSDKGELKEFYATRPTLLTEEGN